LLIKYLFVIYLFLEKGSPVLEKDFNTENDIATNRPAISPEPKTSGAYARSEFFYDKQHSFLTTDGLKEPRLSLMST